MIYRFGSLSLDTDGLDLKAGSEKVAVEPQVFSLLQYLIENRDRVVTKDELIEHVWDGRIVSDATLSSRINAARRAVADDGKTQAIIRTFPRRGFRFVARLTDNEEASDRPSIPHFESDRPTIAVLPFENLTGESNQEHFVDGITEDIITELSKISGLLVIGRHSSFMYKNKAVSLRDVGRELGVRYVLEGSVRKSGEKSRVVAQLVDTSSDHHCWAERYDRDLTDVFEMQAEVARKVAAGLEVAVTADERYRLGHFGTLNAEAHALFQRTISHGLHPPTPENIYRGRVVGERIVEIDPGFAGGHVCISISHSWSIFFGISRDRREDAERCLASAEKAVAADDKLAWAHIARGWCHLIHREHQPAVEAGRRAVDLQPSDSDALAYLGFFLTFDGDAKSGIPLAQFAVRLNPTHVENVYRNILGCTHFNAGEYDQALAVFKENVELGGPIGVPVLTMRIVCHSEMDQPDEARAVLQDLLRISPDISLRTVPFAPFYKNPKDRERFIGALRKIGLPE